jgi:AraC-type DNA-binding domain-containing proteins
MSTNELKNDYKYLIVNDRDKKFGIYINTVGFQHIKPHSQYPLSNHPSEYFFYPQKGRVLHEYQFVYITKGKGLFSVNSNNEQQIKSGTLLFLFPYQWHSYQPLAETGWNEYYIGFEGSVVDDIIENGFFSKENQQLEIGLNEELVDLFARANEVAEVENKSSQQFLSGILLHIIGLVLSISKNQSFETNNSAKKITEAKIIMNENIHSDIDFEELSGKLNMSYTSFRKNFKAYTGYAPAQYFNELKMNKAKQMLVFSTLSVKEIIHSLGYDSYENFFSKFKKATGYTPAQYRAFCRGSKPESNS